MSFLSNKSDEELLLMLSQNSESAFAELYNRYWKKIFLIAVRRLDNFEEAEEIVQDIFSQVWIRRAELNIQSSLNNYLATSVKYRLIKYMDRSFRKKQYIQSLVTVSEEDNGTQEYLSFNELKEELSKYVSELPEKCQLVFTLSRTNGYTQKQIASELSISEKTVESHMYKAIKHLKVRLSEYLNLLL